MRSMVRYRHHDFPESGNSYKPALMLRLCGQTFEGVWTDFGARVTWTPEWRAAVNPMGEIPVLEEEARRLTQTGPILLHLAETHDRFGAGAGAALRDPALALLGHQKLSGATATYRFLRTFAKNADPAGSRVASRTGVDFLGIIDAQVAPRAFVIGDTATIVDLSMCAYLSYPDDETGFDLATTHPHVHAWLGRVAGLSGRQAPYDLLTGKRLPRFV